mmetsp:Transcript_85037/g.134342  ORF Transcript_85037/g.134342 Transcript_85037/m.134342 type:complete len:155 (-) Transcript_85037:52-516(-)
MFGGQRYHRALFRVSRRVDVNSWHLLHGSSNGERPFLRRVADSLLADASKGLTPKPTATGPKSSHRFVADRGYFFARPQVPGTFEIGLATVRQAPSSAKIVLGVFEESSDDPVFLYSTDVVAIDAAGRPAAATAALDAAFGRTRAAFETGRFAL